jgi:hypothetical protein
MAPRKFRRGEVLCRKGDAAKEMFLVVTGKFLVTQLDIEIRPAFSWGKSALLLPTIAVHRRSSVLRVARSLVCRMKNSLSLFFRIRSSATILHN